MKKHHKTIISIVLILASLVLLYFVLYGIGFRNIYETLLKAQPVYLVLAFISVFMMFVVWNLKWHLITKKVAKSSFVALFPMLFAGSFVNTITPGARVGGSPFRLYYLSRYAKQRKSVVFPTVAVDQATNAAVFYMLSVLAVLFVVLFFNIGYTAKIVLESFLVITFLIFISGLMLRKRIRLKILKLNINKALYKVYCFLPLKIFRKRFSTYEKFELYIIERLNDIMVAFKKLSKKDVLFKRDVFLSLLMWVFNYSGTYFVFRAFGHDISLFAVIVVVTLSIILGSLLFVPGGIGIIETVMITLYASFGISSGIAATVAVIDRFIYYFFSLIVGFLCFAYMQVKYK